MAKAGRPGASKGNKKGPTKGTGGKNKRSLAGRGPTPKAEDRAWHPAGKRKAAAERYAAAGGKGTPGQRPPQGAGPNRAKAKSLPVTPKSLSLSTASEPSSSRVMPSGLSFGR